MAPWITIICWPHVLAGKVPLAINPPGHGSPSPPVTVPILFADDPYFHGIGRMNNWWAIDKRHRPRAGGEEYKGCSQKGCFRHACVSRERFDCSGSLDKFLANPRASIWFRYTVRNLSAQKETPLFRRPSKYANKKAATWRLLADQLQIAIRRSRQARASAGRQATQRQQIPAASSPK